MQRTKYFVVPILNKGPKTIVEERQKNCKSQRIGRFAMRRFLCVLEISEKLQRCPISMAAETDLNNEDTNRQANISMLTWKRTTHKASVLDKEPQVTKES